MKVNIMWLILFVIKATSINVNECVAIAGRVETIAEARRYKELLAKVFNIPQNFSEEYPDETCFTGECVPLELCQPNAPQQNAENRPLDQKIDTVKRSGAPPRMCRQPHEVCCNLDAMPNHDSSLIMPPIACGYQLHDEELESRISGGDRTKYGEYPWTIALLVRRAAEKYQYSASGSLIHPSLVMAAAHNVAGRPLSELIARGGEWDIKSSIETYPHEDRQVIRMIIHPQFDNRTLANDIALLLLDRPFAMGKNLNTICLPPANVFTAAGIRCVATGWGRNKLGQGGRHQNVMRRVELPIVSHWDCQRQLRSTRLGKHYRLQRGFLCAGGELGSDTCRGDGGAPLICRVPSATANARFYQAGIVAGGVGCGQRIPGVYVNVAWYSNWILRRMYSLNLDMGTSDSLKISDFYDDNDDDDVRVVG